MHAFSFLRSSTGRPPALRLDIFLAVICCAFAGLRANAQTARFLGEDRTTKGNWRGVYGKEGYNIGKHDVSAPSYGSVITPPDPYSPPDENPPNPPPYYNDNWSAGGNVRGLQRASGTNRVAPVWTTPNTFDVDFNFHDNNNHIISIYCVDWDSNIRSQTIQILNPSTGAVLDTRSVSAFNGGVYVKWEIAGSVKVRMTKVAGSAVFSGIFFDGISSAKFAGEDRITQGNWMGKYGKEGYYIGNTAANVKAPAYGQLGVTGNSYSAWSPGTDVRTLQAPTSTGRIAPYWSTTNAATPFEMTFNSNSNDLPHLLSFYCLDWGTVVRSQKIEIFDFVTNDLLASRDLVDYESGTYAKFEVTGGVRVKITNLAGSASAVVSAVFFDQVAAAGFVGEDRLTKGNWKGGYGSEAHYIGTLPDKLPAYGSLAMTGTSYSTWTPGTDLRGLQHPDYASTERVAPHWFTGSSFEMDFDATEARNFHLLSIYCLDWDNNGRTQKIEIFNRVTGDLLTSCDLSNFQNGTYAKFHVKGGVRVKVSNGVGSVNAVVSAVFLDPINPVRFVGEDRATQGNWKGVYGNGGSYIGTESSNAPSYGSAVLTGTSSSAWTPGEDVRGLQQTTGTGRVAPHWWTAESYDIDFTFNDAKKHVISLYCLDWDNQERSQKIEVMNPETGLIFDTQTISQFQNGVYLRWEITGNVRMRVTALSQTAVISGIFFDETSGVARFVNGDRITKGDWKGAYGSDGYCIPGYPYTLPSYGSSFTVSPGAGNFALAPGDDLRGFQNPVGEGRIAPRWQADSSFDLTFRATDNVTPHLLSVYCVDWENISRSQKIEVFDLVSNDLLDSRGVSSFTNGAFMTWEIKGAVRLRITNTGGADAVLSGVFFDPIMGSRTAHSNFREVPYFRSEPLPPEYQGKSVKELREVFTNNTIVPSGSLGDPAFSWTTKPFGRIGGVVSGQTSSEFRGLDFVNGSIRIDNGGTSAVTVRVEINIGTDANTGWSTKYTLTAAANSSNSLALTASALSGPAELSLRNPTARIRLVADTNSPQATVRLIRGYEASAPEFRPHTALNQFVEDMNGDPLAIAAFVQNEIALVDAIKLQQRDQDISGKHHADEAIQAPLMSQNAYTTFLNRQGSPYEQCNLLTYLLREAGYKAAMVDPVGTTTRILSKRISNMLHLQMKGFRTPEDDALVEVEYPWVVFYDTSAGMWRHLFPWIKDTVVEEGFDLYGFMPTEYNSGRKWLEGYLKNQQAINKFIGGDGEDVPSRMFKNFVEEAIAGDGLSLRDVGVRIYDRKNIYSDWGDLPGPFSVDHGEGFSTLVLRSDWKNDPALYSFIELKVNDAGGKEVLTIGRRGAGLTIAERCQYAMDVNGRSIYLYLTQENSSRERYLSLKIGALDPDGPVDSYNDEDKKYGSVDFPDLAKCGGEAAYHRELDSNGDIGEMWPEYYDSPDDKEEEVVNLRERSIVVSWLNSMGDLIVPASERKVEAMDVAGINLKLGGVSIKGIDGLRARLERMTGRWDRIGSITQLLGQVYFERVDRLGGELQRMHKCKVDTYGLGVTVLKSSAGAVESPRIDMPMYTFPYWNNSLRPDQAAQRADVVGNMTNILALELSAQEHAVINDFYHQKDAISTVKLLRIANKTREIVRSHETLSPGVGGDSGLEFPDGFYEMSVEDFQRRYADAEAATTPAPPATSLPANTPASVIGDLKGVFTRYSKPMPYYPDLGWSGATPNSVPLSNRPAFGIKWAGGPSNEDFLTVAAYTNQATVDANNIYSNFTTGSSWLELKNWCDKNPGGKLYITPGPVKGEDDLLQPSYIGWGSLMVGATGNFAGWIEGNQAVYNGGFGVSFGSTYSSAFNSTNFGNLSISSFGSDFFLTGSGINSINLINPSWEAMNSWSPPYSLSPVTSFSSAYSHGFGSTASGWASVMNDGYFGDSQFHRGWETSPNFVEDPVNVVNGEFYMDEVDLTLPGPLSMELRRNYSSQSEANSILGPGWKLSLMPFLSVSGKNPGDEGYDAVEHANKPKGYLIYAADLDGSVLAFRDQSAALKVTENATWSANSTFITVNNVAGIVVGQTAGAGGIPAHARVTAINTTTKRVTLSVPTTIAKSIAVPVIFGGMGPWKVDAADNPGLKNFNGKEYEETRNPFNDRIEKSDDTYTWYKADGSKLIYAIRAFPIKVEQEVANTFKEFDRRMPYLTHFHDPVGNSFEFSFYAQSNAAAGVAVELQNAEVGYGQLKRIRSSNGNFMLFNYDSQQRVAEVATNDGRRVKYRYDPLGDLVEVELPDGAVSSYEYQHELAPRPDSQVEGANNGNDWIVTPPATDVSGTASGSRVRGWLQPQTTGAYKFRLAANSGEVKLLVSSDDSDAPASLTTALTARNVASATFNLVAGKSYYIETRHTGSVSLSLQWQKPGETSTTWNTINKGNLLKPDKPNPSAADPIARRIVGEAYKNISPATMAGMEGLVQFKGVPYSRNLMTKFTDAEGRVTLNEYDTAFRPDHPVFGDYKYRRVTKQWSSSGPDMVPILTAEFQYNPAGNPWITEGGPGLAPGEKYEVSLLIDKTRPAPDIGDQITTYVHKDGCLRYVAQPLANGFSPSNRDIPYVAAHDWDEVTDVANGSRKVRRLTGSRDLRNLKTVLAYDGTPGVLRSTTTQGEITGEGGVDEATTTYFYNAQNHVIKTILPSPLPGNTGRTQVVYATYPTVAGADTSTGRADDYLYRHRPTKVAKYVVDSPVRTSDAEPAASDKIEETKTTYVEKVDGSLAAYALIGATAKSQFTAGVGQAKEQIDVTYTAKGFPTGKTIQTFSTDAPVTESYVYDHRGLMIENTGPAGRVKRLAYDPRGRPILDEDYTSGSATKPSVWDYSYFNHMGELIWKDGPRYGPEDYQFFDYDGAGRKIVEVVWNSRAKADNSGVEADTYSIVNHYYDGFGNRIKSVDPRGNYSLMTYDVMGRALTSKSYAADGTLLSQQSSTYEPGGEVSNQTDPLGGVTSMSYTSDGKPTLITKPDGSTEKWTYYLDGRVKTHTLENLSVWEYAYDDLLLKETRVLTLGGTLLAKGITTRDIRGNVVSEESFADAGTSYITTKEYDGLGRVIRETGPPALAVGGNPVSDQQEKIYRYSFNTMTHADITTITEGAGASARVTVVTTDDLGREASTVVKDSNEQILESAWTVYDPAHHYVRKFKGSDSAVKADQYLYTDTQGRLVLTKLSDGGAAWKYQRIVYDTAGNAIRATDEEGKTTSNEFDGLNRIKQKLYPDGALVRFGYDGAGNLKSREMPGGLTWYASYTQAGQLDHEYLQKGGSISRYFGYSYYSATGSNPAWVGLLESIDERASGAGAQVRKHDFLYDARRRPSTKTSVGSGDLDVTLTTSYDFLNRVTSSTRTSAVAGGGSVGTQVESAYDGYGQLYSETVSVNGTVQSQLGQRWDSLGMRTGLAAGPGAPAIGGASWARDFGFSYYSNGRLKGISTHSDQYRTSYTYADNGLVTSASLFNGGQKLKEILTPLATAYDSRGRSIGRTTSAAGGQILAETVQRRGDSRAQTYGITRGTGAGGSWGNAAESRAYTYDDRGKLTSESYLTNPSAPSAEHVHETLGYGFDAAKLGVLTSVTKSGGAPVWSATNVDDFARAGGQSSDPALRTFQVKGEAHGPGQFALYIASGHNVTNEAAYAKNAEVSPAPRGGSTPGTANADWVYPISLAPGQYSLQARARLTDYPSRPYEVKSDSVNVTVEGGAIGYVLTHDASGRVTRRTWGGEDFVQDITWSADGHIARIQLTDNSGNGNTGYVWEALYDAQGRRIRTSWSPAGAGNAARVTNSWFDPEIEFLEIAVEYSGKRQWKLHGPDLSGGYGGAQGIGGCEAVIDEGTAEISPVINDFFGNTVAHVKTAGTSVTTDDQVVWREAQMSGYGVLPGFAVAGLEHTGDLLSAMNWQGRRLDPTGFYDMGARAYDPEGRKFLSPDPLGHAASMDLYNYANGDPINHIDPDGRLARMIGGAISSIFEFGRASASAFGEVSEFLGVSDFMGGMGAAARDMSEFVGGSTVDWLMGKSLDRYGPTFEGVAVWNGMMKGVQIAALPLSFVGGPVGVIAMGASSFASFTQGDLAGAAMGGMGAFSAAKAASFTMRAESGLISAGGGVGRNFAGTAPKSWGGTANSEPALSLADDVATLKSIRRYSERLVRGKVTSSNASTMLEVRDIQAAIANNNYRMAGTGFHSLNFKMARDAKSRGFLPNLSIDRPLATPGGILPSRRPDYLFDGGGIYDIKPFRPTVGSYDNTPQFLDIRRQTGIMPVPLYYSLW